MKRKSLIGAIVVVLIGLVVGASIYRNSKPAFSVVKGATVIKGPISEEVFASGRLELSEQQEINAPFAGMIKTVSVKLGDQVQAGQTLFEMDTADLQKQIETAKLNLADAKADLAQATANRNSAIEKAKTQMDQAAGTPGYAAAKQAYDDLVNNPDNTGLGITFTSLKNKVKKDQQALADLQDQLNKAVVKAPSNGIVVALNVVAGSASAGTAISTGGMPADMSAGQAPSGGPLVILGDFNKLMARVKVNEVDSAKVKVGQKVTITGDAFDQTFSGTVDSIAPTAVTTNGTSGQETTVEVLIALEKPQGLKPGYNVNAAIKINEKSDALLVPAEAVVERDNKQVVFVNVDGIAKQRAVTTGMSNDTQVEIVSGLKEGEKVILSPAPTLKEGDKVKLNG